MLQLKNLTLGYTFPLVEQISAELLPGTVCLMIGDNGVGKTTLLKTILNQMPPLGGDISLDGRLISSLTAKEIASQIAVVFSKTEIPANYSVKDLISLGKYIHYPYYFSLTPEDRKEVQRLITTLQLGQYRDTALSALSDGNLQKAFIGRALAQNSPLIILDEPTTHLDETNKIMILQLLRQLAHEQGKTILFSSHDWRLAKNFADNIWYLSDKKFHSGLAEDILAAHPELTSMKFLKRQENFRPPVIEAPDLQKELLLSLLQKHSGGNLETFKFIFENASWQIITKERTLQFQNFEEIASQLSKLSE